VAIVQPGRRPAVRYARSRVLGTRLRRGGHALDAQLNVVPMVDMMTMLVIFLLQQFSATGEVLYLQKDIKLPDARHGAAIEAAPVVAISQAQLVVGGQKLADVPALLAEEALAIPALEEKLQEEHRRWDFVHQNDPDRARHWTGAINVQADVKVPFKLLKRVMWSCGRAGYHDVNFATVDEAARKSVAN
jgi:biopolymer transport protein ExbD